MRSLYPWLLGRSRSTAPSRHPAISASRKRILFLAGSLQGLGLLIATVMAVTGLAMFFGMAGDGSMSDALTMVREAHAISAVFLWIYLVLHLPISFLIHI
jgi:hypothetical protein